MEQIENTRINKEIKTLIQEAIESSPSYNRHEICEKLGELLQTRYYNENKSFHNKELHTTKDLLDKIDIVMIDLMQKKINEEKKRKP